MKENMNRDLRKLLDDFAHDLINYCARIEGDEIVLPKKELSSWVEAYIEAELQEGGGDETI